jgi:hypothetical protein
MDQVGEAELLAAAGAGRTLACGDASTSRCVDAALLRRCCHELRDQIDPRGIWLQHAAIAGSVDLAGLEVRFPLRFKAVTSTNRCWPRAPGCPGWC